MKTKIFGILTILYLVVLFIAYILYKIELRNNNRTLRNIYDFLSLIGFWLYCLSIICISI